MLVWIERLGRVGTDELFGFGLSPDAVTGEILLDPLGNTRIRKKNKAMSESQTLVVESRLDEWIRNLGYCQLSCISAPQYLTGEENAAARRWYTETQTPVFAYSSLGRGLLSGKLKSSDAKHAAKVLDVPLEMLIGYIEEPDLSQNK